MKLIEPHSHSILSEENTRVQSKLNHQQDSKGRVGSPRRSAMSSDDDTKDIKNIYVDSKLLFSSLFFSFLLSFHFRFDDEGQTGNLQGCN